MTEKLVYLFHEGKEEMRSLLGGKGANLAHMTRGGFPVPPGFTITTQACNAFFENNEKLSEELTTQIDQALTQIELTSGKLLGDPSNPLLVSVRSGSVFSMPGMMDTILNLGLNDETARGLATLTSNPRFSYDSYRRFLQMYGGVVLGIDHYHFEDIIEKYKEHKQVQLDTELNAEDWTRICRKFKDVVQAHANQPVSTDPREHLKQSIIAVFRSWNNQRAKIYRKLNHIPDHLGTAVNIQMMVFGNAGEDSGTGVAFTRNPSTGEKQLYGEFLINAQGEDVVAGVRTPEPIASLEKQMPDIYQQFVTICNRLEQHYRDVQDIEFTVERGTLYILQTRAGKRTAQAGIKIAVDLVDEQVISIEEALLRIDPEQLDQLLHPSIDPSKIVNVLTKGLPASPGAATGEIVFNADDAEKKASQGIKVILARPETTPEDIHGILASQGILTSRGGMTSHAAVVARGMGKACICGCEQIKIDLQKKEMNIEGHVFREGDVLSIDGSTGQVINGVVPLMEPELTPEFLRLLHWADEVRKLRVRANADNPGDSSKARELGAEGIGLCRTEHMFMDIDRLPIVRQMILAESQGEKSEALERLLPLQKQDFKEIFRVMAGCPVNIRLLDPPLHEFLPNLDVLTEELRQEARGSQGFRDKESYIRKVRSLHEFNPMLGHRGCRLGIVSPEIYRCQLEAIFLAASECESEGVSIELEIMIPLVGHVNELKAMKELTHEVAQEIFEGNGKVISYTVGTMIEVPRAALTASQVASEADFFSFGTNDLTQMTFGYSRDDAEGKFLQFYLDHKILLENPFIVLDREGVGSLVRMAVLQGRSIKPLLKTGICGEHGGEKRSIQFCHEIGLDYVSCSPYRVPLARLAAAQAVLFQKVEEEISREI